MHFELIELVAHAVQFSLTPLVSLLSHLQIALPLYPIQQAFYVVVQCLNTCAHLAFGRHTQRILALLEFSSLEERVS